MGVVKYVRRLAEGCEQCLHQRVQRVEPLTLTPLLVRPWATVGINIMQIKGSHYLVIYDYFSRYLEVAHMDRLTTYAVIKLLQNIFFRHGIPETVRIVQTTLQPQWEYGLLQSICVRDSYLKTRSKMAYDRKHGFKELEPLAPGELKRQGTIQGTAKYPSKGARRREQKRGAGKGNQYTTCIRYSSTSGIRRSMIAQPFDRGTLPRDSPDDKAEEACSMSRRGRNSPTTKVGLIGQQADKAEKEVEM
ncbi:hypothetical protein PR048_024359 [Dryococelus australis]|uniref:Integrase catalytic domain-containing protein n=1 Tax=Dryococelus australis TaxID=614101 RepID=A0ABQ9GND9_9NEOP|nr:hypothetical protein PR048_024359 [Dryococelus australis]